MNKGREPLRHCQGNRSWATPHQPRSCASVWRDGLRLVRQDQERPAANAGCYRRGRLRGTPHQGAVLRGAQIAQSVERKKGSRPMPRVTTTRHRRGTNFRRTQLFWGSIAMRTEYLTAIVVAAFAAGAGMAVYSMRSQSDFCPQPWAASVTAFFAPCQAFYSAMGHAGSEAVRVSLLTPAEQPDLPPPLLAARLAGSVDPFLHRSGG
jgi:hypothetical protein